jgi:hypothetical protein
MKKKPGPKRITIDWARVDELLTSQNSGQDIAGFLGISDTTLYEHCKQDNGEDFLPYSQKKKSRGKALLKERQWKAAMSGDKTLLVWLGKQYLEQTDKQDVNHGGELNLRMQFKYGDPVKPSDAN